LGLAGWTIYIDANLNGNFDAGEVSTVTDINGNYTFGDLAAGTYRIREVTQIDFTQTSVNPLDIIVTSGVDISGILFGNFQLIDLAGLKFNDLNGDGIQQLGELGLAGWTIYIDANLNGSFDAGEVSTVTDINGNYTFGDLAAGTYRIREVAQVDFTQTSVNPLDITVTSGVDISGIAFGNFQLIDIINSISGTKFNDINGSGTRQAGELGLAGWTIFIDANLNGSFDPGEVSTVTDVNGNYTFGNLAPGTYRVLEVGQVDYVQMTDNPADIVVTTNSGMITGVLFGNIPVVNLVDINKLLLIGSNLENLLNGTFARQANFVAGLYQTLLGRAPDIDGLKYYLRLFLAGYNEQQVTEIFEADFNVTSMMTLMAVSIPPIVDVEGRFLEVFGTTGNDEISLTLGSLYYIQVNGELLIINPASVDEINVHGLSGDDILHVIGTSGNDTVTMGPGTLELIAANITVNANSFSSIDVKTGGGQDLASLFDSAGNDTFTSSSTSARLQGDGYSNQADGFRRVYAYSYAGGFDIAQMNDSSGNDNFVGQQARSWMTGTGYYNSASRFERVNALVTTGFDVSMMWDSAGDDLFQANDVMGMLSGVGFDNRGQNFDRVYGYAYGGGSDTANLFDSSGNDRFVGKEARSIIYSNNYYASASRFDKVNAFAINGGVDRADLNGTSGNDALVTSRDNSRMSSSTYFYDVSFFDTVNAYAGLGGADTTTIMDSSGNDFFLNTPASSYMTWENSQKASVFNFNAVDANALLGGNDTAEYQSLANLDEVFGLDDLASVIRTAGKSSNATGFDTVLAQSLSATGPGTDLTSLDYAFTKTGLWS
ncbi:MAG: collagen binding domain-containing protein, partial [Planctomycetaceae bacterium]